MREILFKAKSVYGGEWLEGHYNKQYNQHCISCICDEEEEEFRVDPDTLCQFTGLLDKNEKKVFEGDILHLTNSSMYYLVDYCKDICSFCVRVIHGERNLENMKIEFSTNFPKFMIGINAGYAEYEIIGNIHDTERTQ